MESLYEGKSIMELDTASDPICPKRFYMKSSRFPTFMSEFNEYDFSDFDVYNNFISRIKVIPFEKEVDLRPSTEYPKELMVSYTYEKLVTFEPEYILDLIMCFKNGKKVTKYLTAVSLLALAVRRCYGNEDFRSHINSTLLRNNYIKTAISGKTVYLKKDLAEELKQSITTLSKYSSIEEISNGFIGNPYIFIWRD